MELPRRHLLRLGGAALVTGLAPSFAAPVFASTLGARTLSFESLHTGEKFSGEYWANGKYLPDALAEINRVMRDRRNQKIGAMDPKVIDLLTLLRHKVERTDPFMIICGYRSPESNAKMAAASSGVAKKSLHMTGQAIDVRLPGCALKSLHGAALDMQCGGVGYYPAANFIHVDTGRVRKWFG
jgi:uncharacterized protein YcbK (DUF882 family)